MNRNDVCDHGTNKGVKMVSLVESLNTPNNKLKLFNEVCMFTLIEHSIRILCVDLVKVKPNVCANSTHLSHYL